MQETENWPAWYYGPNGASQVFNGADEVPEGWQDHPSKVDGKAPPELPKIPGGSTDPTDVDSQGNAWDPEINTASKAKTATGLWQLLPGKKRPAPVTLDL